MSALRETVGILPPRAPRVGELVEVRSRRWLVEAVEDSDPEASPRVSLACADDDAQGQTLEVYWDFEIDRRILEQEAWSTIGARGFDPPRYFSAFLHTLRWNDRRVLIFTGERGRHEALPPHDARGGRRRHRPCRGAHRDHRRTDRRSEAQGDPAPFQNRPARDPLRVLIATYAAREGLNFQAYCTDLFHFDLPWNPGRIEQRNGRIDRKLQPAPTVRCRYFVLPQRTEDRVLDVLVKKTETIRYELGSLSKVIDEDIERRLRRGGDPPRRRGPPRTGHRSGGPRPGEEARRSRRARGRPRAPGSPQGADRTVPRAARPLAALGAVRGGTVPGRDVMLPGDAGHGAVGGRSHRGRGSGLDVSAT